MTRLLKTGLGALIAMAAFCGAAATAPLSPSQAPGVDSGGGLAETVTDRGLRGPGTYYGYGPSYYSGPSWSYGYRPYSSYNPSTSYYDNYEGYRPRYGRQSWDRQRYHLRGRR